MSSIDIYIGIYKRQVVWLAIVSASIKTIARDTTSLWVAIKDTITAIAATHAKEVAVVVKNKASSSDENDTMMVLYTG
jgi:hypothetical protein